MQKRIILCGIIVTAISLSLSAANNQPLNLSTQEKEKVETALLKAVQRRRAKNGQIHLLTRQDAQNPLHIPPQTPPADQPDPVDPEWGRASTLIDPNHPLSQTPLTGSYNASFSSSSSSSSSALESSPPQPPVLSIQIPAPQNEQKPETLTGRDRLRAVLARSRNASSSSSSSSSSNPTAPATQEAPNSALHVAVDTAASLQYLYSHGSAHQLTNTQKALVKKMLIGTGCVCAVAGGTVGYCAGRWGRKA